MIIMIPLLTIASIVSGFLDITLQMMLSIMIVPVDFVLNRDIKGMVLTHEILTR